MIISSTPADYAGAFSDVIYRLADVVPEQTIEVSVLGEQTTDVLGIKRYRGQSEYAVNISNYVRRKMDVTPAYRNYCGTYTPEGRLARARIKVGSTLTPLCHFTSGIKAAGAGELLSDAPFDMRLAKGELDELTFRGSTDRPIFVYGFLNKGSKVHEMVFGFGAQGDVVLILVNADDVALNSKYTKLGTWDAYSQLEVCIEKNSKLVPVRRYALRPQTNDSVRMCWVNKYGMLDYYTFVKTRSGVATDKKKVYTSGGYKSYDPCAERFIAVESGYENEETLQWLLGIVSSPRVWAYAKGAFTEMDVVTGTVSGGGAHPSSVSLTLREAKRTSHQSF